MTEEVVARQTEEGEEPEEAKGVVARTAVKWANLHCSSGGQQVLWQRGKQQGQQQLREQQPLPRQS